MTVSHTIIHVSLWVMVVHSLCTYAGFSKDLTCVRKLNQKKIMFALYCNVCTVMYVCTVLNEN